MGGKSYSTETDKLVAMIEQNRAHWLWKGPRTGDKARYGLFWFDGRKEVVHRTAYRLFVGPIPDRHDIHHICKIRLCVRPSHLQAVTRSEHLRLEPSARRHSRCKYGHPMSGANLYTHKMPDGSM